MLTPTHQTVVGQRERAGQPAADGERVLEGAGEGAHLQVRRTRRQARLHRGQDGRPSSCCSQTGSNKCSKIFHKTFVSV